jgi:hypothetical protein
MKLPQLPDAHLTYCLNVHPGESWQENFQAIRTEVQAVRERLESPEPFGLGLRLSNAASLELTEGSALADLKSFLSDHGLYVFTVNAFPYGAFHGQSVKENVYAPDWQSPQRRQYTLRVARILSRLLPEGVLGSISSVPGSYKPWIRTRKQILDIAFQLAQTAKELQSLAQETGKTVVLGLEPEPDCLISTTDELIRFCKGPLQTWGFAQLARKQKLDPDWVREVLWFYVGACLDLAHQAVEFEDPARSLLQLKRSGITLAKMQLSAALEAEPGRESLEILRHFDEQVYLHQTKAQLADGRIVAFPDLPAAFEAWSGGMDVRRWRTHFHVPLFFDQHGPLRSTRDLIGPELLSGLARTDRLHLEIETYTFTVLPDFLRPACLAEGIAREYRWFRQVLDAQIPTD